MASYPTHEAAGGVLAAAITSPHGLAELTTAPTAEQQAALRAVDPAQPAPLAVCDEMDLDPGSTWGAVLREVAFDVATSIDDEADE